MHFPLSSLARRFFRSNPDPLGVQERATRSGVLWKYFLLTYLLLLVNASFYLEDIRYVSIGTLLFSVVVYLTYCATYLLPFHLLVLGANRALSWGPFRRRLPGGARARSLFVYGSAVFLFSLVQLFILIDNVIYEIFGFHFNGFVWNLIMTKGGIESMGGERSAYVTSALLVILVLGIQTGLLVLIVKAARFRRFLSRLLPARVVVILFGLFVVGASVERVSYGVSNIYSYKPILFAARAFPFYIPCTFDLPEWLVGDVEKNGTSFEFDEDLSVLDYPLHPLREAQDPPRYNIVWLVAESWRADMLDTEIMPAAWKFSERSTRFLRHYSGGNGTRMGIFAMFYGLYGNYWFPFLDAVRGPVLIDVLLARHYQMFLYTSAKFTYPEFDKTVWARIPPDQLHEGDSDLEGWENDRVNVTKLLQDIDSRDPARPFLAFLFFESPHARYYFPPESIIRPEYLKDFNYLTADLKDEIGLIKNRYINSCHHLDSQYKRVIDFLEQRGLLDSTIVIITSDHGEEFMEKGRWGHNSTFSEEQVLSPLVLWVPGRDPAVVDRMTSHLDLPATLLTLLGVENPPSDYSLGFDLFGPDRRTFTIVSDWNNAAIVTDKYKAEFALRSIGFNGPEVTTRDDAPVENPNEFLESQKDVLVQVMREMSRFGK
jgi:membrane-anchored protein YejM (alkaline phosphatase superfamily)